MSLCVSNLSVEGMSCPHCEGKIEKTLKAVLGVENAEASTAGQMVKISYDDSRVTLLELKKAIEGIDSKKFTVID